MRYRRSQLVCYFNFNREVTVMWGVLCVFQFLLLLIIFGFLGLTGTPDQYVPTYNDKVMHSTGYFIAAFSISFAFPCWRFWQRAAFLIVYSIGIEIGQHFSPPRTFDVFDIAANSSGVIVGLIIIALSEKYISGFRKLLSIRLNS